MNLTTAFSIQTGDHVAFVGGGGKSNAMFRLGRELAAAGRRVLLTTTTRIFAAQIAQAPAHVIFDPRQQTLTGLLPALEEAVARRGQVLLIGAADAESGKAFGLGPEVVDALTRSGRFDVVLNEADGSRMRPFKAPAPHEPVIPATTTLVVPVVGLDVLGRPLTDEHAHRAARIAELAGVPLAAPVTPAMVARVLAHPDGGLKGVPPSARVIPLLNKLDRGAAETAHALARRLLRAERIDSVVVGAVGTETPVGWVERRVAAVVLAAGEGRRFGGGKQLALWRGKPLLLHAVDAALASEAEPVVVVLGARAEACRAALGDRPVTVVVNRHWARGQSTSLKSGLAALPPRTGAAVFLLADQPRVSAAVVDALLERYRQTLAPVVWPEFEGRRGNPVLFDRRLFPEMMRLRGDVGARPVLLAHRHQAARVPLSDPAILHDVDTPADLEGDGTSVRIEGGR